MSYCNSTDTEAVVNLKKNGKAFQVAINGNLPINISCKNNGFNNGISVTVTFSYRRYFNATQFTDIISSIRLTTPINGIRGQKYTSFSFPTKPQQIAINAQGNWIVVADIGAGSGYFENISIDSIVPVNPSVVPTPKGVIIKDKNGSIIYDDNTIDCTWDVICGGGCPEGFYKCTTSGYPGYCCLDCASTAANIRSITNELRGRNG